MRKDDLDDPVVTRKDFQTVANASLAAKLETENYFMHEEAHAGVILEERIPEEKADLAPALA